MDAPSSLHTHHCNGCLPVNETDSRDDNGTVIIINSKSNCLHSKVENHPRAPIGCDARPLKKSKKRTKPRKRVALDVSVSPSWSQSASSSAGSLKKGAGFACKRRNPKFQVRRSGGHVAAIGFPLGMSFAAVVAQVLYRRDIAAERMSPEHLSSMCIMAVRESLANVFDERLDGLTRNFEQSFGSTLNTLRSIYNSSMGNTGDKFNNRKMKLPTSDFALDTVDCTGDLATKNCHSEAELSAEIHDQSNSIEELKENTPMNLFSRDLAVHGQSTHVISLSQSPISSGSVTNNSMISVLEKSALEQSRSNDLKTLELSLTMRRLKLKETQLALNYDLNHLQRSKLSMGISKASFKAEKFKTQLEDLRHAELIRKCIDCLIAGIFVMLSSLFYGGYVYSYERIAEATASCSPSSNEYSAWWTPKSVTSFNSRLHVLWCQIQVITRMAFGVLMIFAVAYLLFQRSTTLTHTMPITFMLLLLGAACGYCGKLCVDTLGGNGYLWLLYWEILCLLHFLSIVCTSTLFLILHGPVNQAQTSKGNIIISHWIRRFVFYATLLVFLPLSCGLLPFASLGQWKDHFLLKVTDYLTDFSERSLPWSMERSSLVESDRVF